MKKYLGIVCALVLAVSLLMVPAAPAAAAVGEGIFIVDGGTYTTTKVDADNGNISATLIGSWDGGDVIGDFSATGEGTFGIDGKEWGTKADISVLGTLSADGITFSGTALRIEGDPITGDLVTGILGTITIEGGTFVAALTGTANVPGVGPMPCTINFSGDIVEPSGDVDMVVNIPSMVAISVTPTSIDFGTLYPGQFSGIIVVTVENIGTVTVNVDASVDPTPTVFDYLLVGTLEVPTTGLIAGLAGGSSSVVDVQLVVPSDYSAKGVETATLVFSATAQ